MHQKPHILGTLASPRAREERPRWQSHKGGTNLFKLELLGHHFYGVSLGTSANIGALWGGQLGGWDLRGHLGGYHNTFSFLFSMIEAVLKWHMA